MEALKTDMVLWQNRIVKVEDCVGVLKKHISRGKKRQEKLGEMITAIATQKAAVEKAELEVRKIRENQKVHDPQAEMEGKTVVAIVPSFAERYLSTALFEGL